MKNGGVYDQGGTEWSKREREREKETELALPVSQSREPYLANGVTTALRPVRAFSTIDLLSSTV